MLSSKRAVEKAFLSKILLTKLYEFNIKVKKHMKRL